MGTLTCPIIVMAMILERHCLILDIRDMGQIIAATGAEVWIWNRNRGGRVTHKMGGHGCRLYCLR